MTWHSAAALLLPAGIGPNPVDGPETPPGFDPNTVTPGVVGFIAIALVALAAILLIMDMTRRIRRVRYRAEIREQLEAEKQMISEGGPAEPDPMELAAERGIEGDEQDGRPVA